MNYWIRGVQKQSQMEFQSNESSAIQSESYLGTGSDAPAETIVYYYTGT